MYVDEEMLGFVWRAAGDALIYATRPTPPDRTQPKNCIYGRRPRACSTIVLSPHRSFSLRSLSSSVFLFDDYPHPRSLLFAGERHVHHVAPRTHTRHSTLTSCRTPRDSCRRDAHPHTSCRPAAGAGGPARRRSSKSTAATSAALRTRQTAQSGESLRPRRRQSAVRCHAHHIGRRQPPQPVLGGVTAFGRLCGAPPAQAQPSSE